MAKKTKKKVQLYDEHGRWYNEHYAIKGAMRVLYRQHPSFHEAIANARVELSPKVLKNGEVGKKNQIFYQCAICNNLFKIKNIAVDHIDPVIPLYKRDKECDYNELVRRMYVRVEYLQVVCNTKKKDLPKGESSCHSKKTREENHIRDYVINQLDKLGINDMIERESRSIEFLERGQISFQSLLAQEKKELEEKKQRQLEREKKKLAKAKK